MKRVFFLAGAMLLLACARETGSGISPQVWQQAEVVIETRPAPPRPGMNEFLVIVTDSHGLPVHDLIVSLRMSDKAAWQQAIQDGHTGVYRRALPVKNSVDKLQVQLKQGEQQGVLQFILPGFD